MASNHQATFSSAVLNGAEVLSICGEIDIANKGQLELALHEGLAHNSGRFVANLLDVTYADSSCLHAVYGAHRTARDMNKPFIVVIKKGGGLEKILQIACLLPVFEIRYSLDAALVETSEV